MAASRASWAAPICRARAARSSARIRSRRTVLFTKEGPSPPMEGGMSGFDRNTRANAGCAAFPAGGQRALDAGAIRAGLAHARLKGQVGVDGSGRGKLDRVAGRDRAGRVG